MDKLWKAIPLLTLSLILGYLVIGSTSACAQAQDEAPQAAAEEPTTTEEPTAPPQDEKRKAKILANLQLQFPQLAQQNVTMDDLKPSGFEGLDEGSFTWGGRRTQRFLVSTDDTKLFMISGQPIDVSRSADEVEVELAKRAEEEKVKAEQARQELKASVAGLPVRGNPEGSVTIVEFSDFQCPYCGRGAKTIDEIIKKYPDDVKVVFKHFPLAFHKWAKPAAIAAVCAAEQSADAFWALHDKYFEHQKEVNEGNVLAKSKEYLTASGIDMAQWSACAENTETEAYKAAAATVDADMAFGSKVGVSGTPAFFVNGRFLSGAQPITAFEPLIVEAKSDPQ